MTGALETEASRRASPGSALLHNGELPAVLISRQIAQSETIDHPHLSARGLS
jgi:hypothetical protein